VQIQNTLQHVYLESYCYKTTEYWCLLCWLGKMNKKQLYLSLQMLKCAQTGIVNPAAAAHIFWELQNLQLPPLSSPLTLFTGTDKILVMAAAGFEITFLQSPWLFWEPTGQCCGSLPSKHFKCAQSWPYLPSQKGQRHQNSEGPKFCV
jgi:hypothetical protein